MSSSLKDIINMKAAVNLGYRIWLLWLLLLAGAVGNSVRAQNLPGCDPLGTNPVVDFQLTYDATTNRYTAWYIPTDNTLHRLVTGQYTIISPNGFTTPEGNGRDASLQITNINGSWSDEVVDNEYISSVGQTPLSALNGYTVHQVGMAPQAVDVDPDGTGNGATRDTPVTAGRAVPLFSFPGTGCVSELRILVNDEPIRNALYNAFRVNINNTLTIQVPRAPFIPNLERYCKNATLNTVKIVLPDIQDDNVSLCATSTSYTNNYFTQVFRNWNAANLPAGSIEVAEGDRQWDSFTVSPASMQSNVTINPQTGQYTITFPTDGQGNTLPGSLTICNSLRDDCNTANDQACVVVSWLSSGSVSITNNPTVCLSNGSAPVTLTATDEFTVYNWSGPGLTASTGNSVNAVLTSAGIYSYTVVATNSQSCTATSTTSITVVEGAMISGLTASNPTSCSGTNGSLVINGLTANQSYTISYNKNGSTAVSQNLSANGSGQITISGLSAGVYSLTASKGGCTSDPVSATLSDPSSPASPTISLSPSSTICLGSAATLTASGALNATFNWTGANLSQTAGNSVTVTPTNAGSFDYSVTQTVGGCTSMPASATVIVNPAPTVTATALSATACVGGTISLSATASGGTAGYVYTWSGPNFSTTTTANPVTISNSTTANSGNYIVAVTDANQCSATALAPATVNVINCCSLTATVVASQSSICAGTSVTLSVTAMGNSGAISYQWSPNINSGNTASVTVTPTATTTYTVVVTDGGAANCTRMETVTVQVSPAPTLVSIATIPACVGQTLSLSAAVSGGTTPYSYSWQTPDGQTLSGNPVNRVNAQSAMSGTYTLTLTDANGCVATQTVSTTVGVAPSVQVQPQQVCAGSSVTLTAAGGDDASTYFWSGPNGFTASGKTITLINVEVSGAGSYTLAITGGNACTGTAQGVVAVNSGPVVNARFVSTSVCTGNSINLLGDVTTGTVPPYTFNWSGPDGFTSTIQNPTISSARAANTGRYTLVVTDQNGCSAAATTPVAVTVAECCPPRAATVSIVAHDPACGSSNGSAMATLQPASPAGAQFTYQWRNVVTNVVVGNTASISNLIAGVYSVIITETNSSCVQSFTGTVSISDTPGPDITGTSITGANCGASNSSVQLTVAGGETPYMTSWSGPTSGSITANSSPILISNLGSGNYIFTVTGSNSSCKGIEYITIPVLPTSLSLSAQVYQPATCGISGTVMVSWNSIGGPYQLMVDGVASSVSGTSQTLALGAGTHIIQVSSGNPLCVSDSKVITINPTPAPSVIGWNIQQQPICADQSGTIAFSGGQAAGTIYTISYLNGGIIGTTTGNTPQTYSVGAGIYTVTRMESTNCVSTETFEIIAPQSISFNVKTLEAACGLPGSLTVTNASGGTPSYIVKYNGPVSGSTTVGAGISGLTAGNYTVSVTDSKGCSATTTITIGAGSQAPEVIASISSSTACVGGSFVLNASVNLSGNFTYSWRGPNGFAATGSAVTINQAQATHSGSYTVIVTATGGCSATGVTATSITVSPCQPPCNLGINAIATNAHCGNSDGQVMVTANGGSGSYRYRWSTGATTPSLAGVATGTYSVTVSDALNTQCFSTLVVAVGNENGPQIALGSVTPATCLGATGAASVNVTGGATGYTYKWNNGSVTNAISGVVAGVYSVTVTDQAGCQDVLSVSVPSTAGTLIATVNGTPSTCGQSNGAAQAVVTGGTQPYQYRWNTGAVTSSITNQIAGIYSVTVTDGNGCQTTASISIVDTNGPQLTLTNTNAVCQGTSTGTATANVVGGTAPYTYSWSNGSTSANINGLSAGVYTVVVTDASGCKASGQVTVVQPEAILARLSASSIACGMSTGTINLISVTGGTPNYTYLWNNGATTPSLTGVAAGTYTLTITDANGCKATGVATLSLPTGCTICQKPSLTVTGPLCNTAQNTYNVDYIVSSGASVTASVGTVNASLNRIENITAGQNVIITALSSCGAVTSSTVIAPISCTVTSSCTTLAQVSIGQAICIGNNSYIASVTATSGAIITALGGTVSNGIITGTSGTNVTVVATIPGCNPVTAIVTSPASCTTACVEPLISIAGTQCNSTSYSVRYTVPAGVLVVASAGTVSNGLISGIALGVPLSVTVSNASCPAQIVNIAAPANCNKPPLVPGHPVVTVPGDPVTVCLPITDPNVGDTHTVRLCAQPANGIVSLPMTVNNTNHTVCFTYTPNAGFTGLDQVCLITCDQGGLCDTTYVPITIVPFLPPTPVIHPPSVPVTPIVTMVDVPKTQCYPILDPNVGDIHSFTVCGEPEHGTASVSINNTTHQICVTYTPNAGYSGPDELCLKVCDQTGLCTTVMVPIVVIPNPGPPTRPQPPTVVPPVIVTPVDVPQTVCVQINDPNSTDIHTASICGQPDKGTVVVTSVNNSTHMVCVTYTPPAGYSGQPLGGCLEVCDQDGLCTQVPITITVIPGPPTPCPTIAVHPFPSDPTSCTANNGSLTLTGLTPSQSYTVCYTKNLDEPFCQTLTANQNGRILVSGLGVGVYTNIAVSKNGCTSNAVSVTLAGGLPAPTATCSVTAVCAGESITLTAKGTNIQWFGSGLQKTTGSPVTAIPTLTGIVTYTAIQSANGCVSPPATVTVVVKPTPTFSVSATSPTVCNALDGKIALIGLTPGQSYTVCYTKDNGLPVCAERLANINGLLTIAGLSAGTYTNITVNELGCLSTAKSITLTNPVLPNPVVTVAPSLTVCLGQPISLTATGQPGAVFTWKGQGLLSTVGNIVTVNPQSTGTLSYTVTQSIAGCGSSSTVTAITVNPVPSAVLISKQDPNSCINPNGTILLGGLLSSQQYTVCYRVNNVGSTVCSQLSSNGSGTIALAGLTSGSYSVTVSNGNCTSLPVSATLVGQTPAQPNVAVTPSATICIGQSATLTASSTAEGSFSWTGPDLSSIAGGTITTTPTTTGVLNYTVIQTVNGCVSIPAIIPITVVSIPSPVVVATTAPTTCSGTNGSITLGGLTANQSYTVCSNSGGITKCAPFTAAGNSQLVVTNVSSGAYSLTILSGGGCYNAVPVSASVASSTACSACTDAPLIIAQPLLICRDSTKTVSMAIIDADLSDSFSATVCGVGMSNSTVTVSVDNQTRQLHITYRAEPGFQGIDQVCVTVRDKCGNFDQVYIPIQVIRCVCGCKGTPPVVVPQPIITTKNTPKEICVPIVDTPTDTHTAILCGGPQNGTAVVTVNNQTRMLCVLYTPKPGYVGTDKVCITICDQTNLCTTIEVPITVVDESNPPTLSVVPLVTNCSSTTSAHMPIADSDADNTHMVTIVSQPQNGTITATIDNVTHRLLVFYTPAPGFMGNDVAIVRVTDSDGLSSDNTDIPLHVTPGSCPTCTTIDLKVLLEGPYNQTTGKMNTILNQRGLLPGQTPIEQVGATPAGQPYNTAPWNYTGTESVSTYSADIVDWVLVSLRSSELSTTPVFRVAGLLHDDGRITFVNPCFNLPEGQYFATVEHRNHMGVMSPMKVAVINNKLTFDFTQQNSYTIADPPSFGEINIDGKWMMYGGDGKKVLYNDNFDINFLDSKLWKEESGNFDQYRYGDFNMDADVNFSDSVLWKRNNGRYSKVPH